MLPLKLLLLPLYLILVFHTSPTEQIQCQSDADCTPILNSTGYCVFNMYNDGVNYCVCPWNTLWAPVGDPTSIYVYMRCISNYICTTNSMCNYEQPKPYDTHRICRDTCVCEDGYYPDRWRCINGSPDPPPNEPDEPDEPDEPTTPEPDEPTTPTPSTGDVSFHVPNQIKCPPGFPETLLSAWNTYARPNMAKLSLRGDLMAVAQSLATNESGYRPGILPSSQLGTLNYSLVLPDLRKTISADSQVMVTQTSDQLPVTINGHFSAQDWAQSDSFGVGCAAFINKHFTSELLITMVWESGNSEVEPTTLPPPNDDTDFIVPNSLSCPRLFPGQLLDAWNKYSRNKEKDMALLRLDAYLTAFAQNAAANASVNHSIVMPDYTTGIFHYSHALPSLERYIRVDPVEIVRKTDGSIPMTKNDSFSWEEWKATNLLGVGCATFPNKALHSELYIAMAWGVRSEVVTTTTMATTISPDDFIFDTRTDNQCPGGFAEALVADWNKYARQSMSMLHLDSDSTLLAQQIAANATTSFYRPVSLPDNRTGLLNYTRTWPEFEQHIAVSPLEVVRQSADGQLPVTLNGHFSRQDWAEADLFGVGCVALFSEGVRTQLFIALVWRRHSEVVPPTTTTTTATPVHLTTTSIPTTPSTTSTTLTPTTTTTPSTTPTTTITTTTTTTTTPSSTTPTTAAPTTTTTTTTPSTTTPSTTTPMTTTPEDKQFEFDVKRVTDEQECPAGFPEALLATWNEVRLPEGCNKLVISRDVEDVGKEAVKNVTLGRDIVLPDANFGELHFAKDAQVGSGAFYYYTDWIVQNMKESGTLLPAINNGHHFTKEQWKRTEIFGVGCTAYTDTVRFTKLYISMIWKYQDF